MKSFGYFALFLTMLITACGNNPELGAVATATSGPTIMPSPTNTPTEMPTATALPSPTATEQLSPTEQLERDYGTFVPLDEKCVKSSDAVSNPDETQNGTHYALLQVHATNPNDAQWMKISLGPLQDLEEREVLVLSVVCRDANGNLMRLPLILGGKDFGKNGADLNVYYLESDSVESKEGVFESHTEFKVTPIQEMLNYMNEGDRIEIYMAILPGEGPLKKFGAGYEGGTNELQILALNMLKYNSRFSEAANLLAQGNNDLPSDFVIIPARIALMVVPPPVNTTGYAWEFETDGYIDWVVQNQLDPLKVSNGNLITKSTGDDPYMVSPMIAANTSALSRLEIRMKVSNGDLAQLYFITQADRNYDEIKVLNFPIIPDGEFHIYTLNMADVKSWNGIISQLRLDPTIAQGTVEIDYIRLTQS